MRYLINLLRFQLDLAKSHWIQWDFRQIWLNRIKSSEISAKSSIFSSFSQNPDSDRPVRQLLEVWFARSDQFLCGRRVNGCSTRASRVECRLSPNPIRPDLWTTLVSLLANKLLKTTRSQCFRSCGLESLDFGGYERVVFFFFKPIIGSMGNFANGLRSIITRPTRRRFLIYWIYTPPCNIWVLHNYEPHVMGERMHKIIILWVVYYAKIKHTWNFCIC